MDSANFRAEGLFKLSQLKLEVSMEAANLVTDYLLGLGSLGVAEDIKQNDMREVSAYFPMDSDIAEVIEELKQYLDFLRTRIPGIKVNQITAEHIDQSSWQVWKSLLTKVRAGNRVIIRPPWEEHQGEGDELVIEINPSLAFGTGHHETTRLCIEVIEKFVSEEVIDSILDVGCGSGILSIAAVMLGVKNVTGFDTDPIAVLESEKNAEKNDVKEKIKFFCGYLQSVKGQYDLIVANVYIEPILSMKNEFKQRLSPGGALVVSGIPHTRKDEAVRGLKSAGFILHDEFKQGDWVALVFRMY